MKSSLKKFLASGDARSKSAYHSCSVCPRKAVADDVLEFMEAKASGLEEAQGVSFLRYVERFLIQNHADCPRVTAVRKHVIQCLGRDVVTGKKVSQ